MLVYIQDGILTAPILKLQFNLQYFRVVSNVGNLSILKSCKLQVLPVSEHMHLVIRKRI